MRDVIIDVTVFSSVSLVSLESISLLVEISFDPCLSWGQCWSQLSQRDAYIPSTCRMDSVRCTSRGVCRMEGCATPAVNKFKSGLPDFTYLTHALKFALKIGKAWD